MNISQQFGNSEQPRPERRDDESSGQLSHVKAARLSEPLLTEPLCRTEDLGRPIPNSPFAVSVALPRWKDVVDYEEGDARVTQALHSGYPRFVVNGYTGQLFEQVQQQHCKEGEALLAFPTEASAKRCRDFVREEYPRMGRIAQSDYAPLTVCIVPEEAYQRARAYWQHGGEIVSNRLAQACLEGSLNSNVGDDLTRTGIIAKDALRRRLSDFVSSNVSDTFLFPSGMAGIAAVQRAIQAAYPGRKTAQVGFPYVDTLKVQEKFGRGCLFIPTEGPVEGLEFWLNSLDTLMRGGKIGAIYCEFPANPLLRVPPLEWLSDMSHDHNIPLIIDDTLGAFTNVRVLPHATAIVTSLTKYFSGEGDVCAGSVIWNREHPSYQALFSHFAPSYEDQIFAGDAVVLEQNSRDFPSRMARINAGTAQLVEFLSRHDGIEAIHYPTQDPRQQELYDLYKVKDGGYGGLFSMIVKGGIENAARVYDALEVCKGPSLGANFTLACPYTLLAHYTELPRVAKQGVLPQLIRVSVGLEDPQELIARFERALASSL